MKRRFLNSLMVMGGLAAIAFACSKSDPAPLVNTPSFTSVVDSYQKTAPTGIVVKFTSTAQNALSYSWDFGDGSTPSTEASPTKVYSAPGTYIVVLTTKAAAGATPTSATKSTSVDVTDPTLALTNIILGGDMEAADATKWTKIYSGQKTGTTFNHVNGNFGVTTNKPKDGTAGAFTVTNSLPGEEAGSVYYQQVNLAAGIYKFSTAIKHDAENRTGTNNSALKEYWFEMFVGKRAPTFDATIPAPTGNDNGYNDSDPTPDGQPGAISGFIYNSWTGRAVDTDYPATDGTAPQVIFGRKARSRADKNGVFEVTAANAGAYYVIFKIGKGNTGGFGTNGISIDNLRLVKLP